MNLEDTIVAISTPIGESGIGIVRMSGKNAFFIAKKLFVPARTNQISWTSSFKIYYGWIMDPETKERVDEVLLSLMRAPRTYTREDIVEINCHGGPVVLRRVLELCLKLGARLAEPGEFTKRAFLNGRIDLSQAESVLEIVKAKTEKSLQLAVKSLEGRVSNLILTLRDKIIDVLSALEAEIDFCEEEIEVISRKEKGLILSQIERELSELVENARSSEIFREGIKVVIAGRPNVGKSSLLNSMLQRERVIVSQIPGTTRDTIEEYINIKGFPVKMVDTAGLGKTEDPLAEEGAKRTRHYLEEADIIIALVDGSCPLTDEDREILELLKEYKKKILPVINKIDLPQKICKDELKKLFPQTTPLEISALRGDNLEGLKNEILNLILKDVNVDSDQLMINLRQKKCLEKAQEFITKAREGLNLGVSEEFLILDIREALKYLDQITGRNLGDEVLDRIFSNFCIGK